VSYAERTSVPVERSRAELEALLARAGAEAFAYAWKDVDQWREAARRDVRVRVFQLGFTLKRLPIRVDLPMPALDEFARSSAGRVRTPLQREQARADEERRRWRALVLVVKAKLEAVATGITTFEKEFLADVVVGGSTVGQEFGGELCRLVRDGKVPKLLGE
jgi:hypothetical protein